MAKERRVKKVQARHILVGSKELAEELKVKIDEGEEFTKLAEEHSECPSKKRGGDLGWFGNCLLYTSPSPRDLSTSRMPSSA